MPSFSLHPQRLQYILAALAYGDGLLRMRCVWCASDHMLTWMYKQSEVQNANEPWTSRQPYTAASLLTSIAICAYVHHSSLNDHAIGILLISMYYKIFVNQDPTLTIIPRTIIRRRLGRPRYDPPCDHPIGYSRLHVNESSRPSFTRQSNSSCISGLMTSLDWVFTVTD